MTDRIGADKPPWLDDEDDDSDEDDASPEDDSGTDEDESSDDDEGDGNPFADDDEDEEAPPGDGKDVPDDEVNGLDAPEGADETDGEDPVQDDGEATEEVKGEPVRRIPTYPKDKPEDPTDPEAEDGDDMADDDDKDENPFADGDSSDDDGDSGDSGSSDTDSASDDDEDKDEESEASGDDDSDEDKDENPFAKKDDDDDEDKDEKEARLARHLPPRRRYPVGRYIKGRRHHAAEGDYHLLQYRHADRDEAGRIMARTECGLDVRLLDTTSDVQFADCPECLARVGATTARRRPNRSPVAARRRVATPVQGRSNTMPADPAFVEARRRRIAAARRTARKDAEAYIQVRSQEDRRRRRRADIENPAQPIDEPAGEEATYWEEPKDVDVASPGVSDPSLGESSPAAVDSPGAEMPEEPNTGDTEVTTPTTTAGPNPGYEEADITTVESPGGEGDVPLEEALDDEDYNTNVETVAARTFAAMRLARVEASLGLYRGSDLARAQQIESTMTRAQIEARLATLAEVEQARPQTTPGGQVVGNSRTSPSLRSFVGSQNSPTLDFDPDAGIFS